MKFIGIKRSSYFVPRFTQFIREIGSVSHLLSMYLLFVLISFYESLCIFLN
jgi:hypothetical protein